MKPNKEFEKWAHALLEKYIDILCLQSWSAPELRYSNDMTEHAIFTVHSNYPYRWITIKYGNYAIEMFNDKNQRNDLKHGLLHELVHIVLGELRSKAESKSTDKEINDTIETTTEHITVIIRRLLNE